MFSLRTHALITGGIFAAMLLLPYGLNTLLPAGDAAALELPVNLGFFALFLALGFSAVPLMLKLFIAGQRAIGNGDAAPIRALEAHQTAIVVGVWLFFLLGAALAVPAAIEDGMLGPAATRSLNALLRGKSQGKLVAGPGMTVAAVIERSTLKLDDGAKPLALDLPVYAAGAVFDFEIPGTDLVFPGCRYYYMSTYTHDRTHFEAVNIGTAHDKMTRAELDADNAALRARLAAGGWLTGHEVYRTAEDQRLHGGKTRGEEGRIWLIGEAVLTIGSKRLDDPARGEDAATAGAWIQFIDLWLRRDYPGIERFVFAPPENRS